MPVGVPQSLLAKRLGREGGVVNTEQGGPESGPRATIQELNDLGQLVKLSGFGFLFLKWGQ